MPWLVLSMLWGRLKNALGWITANPDRILVALLGASAIYGWHEHTSSVKWAEKDKADLAAYNLAVENSRKVASAYAEKSKEKANDGQSDYAAIDRAVSDRTSVYISAHRMLPQAAPGNPAAAAKGGNPEFPAIPSAEAVLADLNDIRVCSANYTYAKAAYDWASHIND